MGFWYSAYLTGLEISLTVVSTVLQRGLITWDENIFLLLFRKCSLRRKMFKSKRCTFSVISTGYFVPCDTVCPKKICYLDEKILRHTPHHELPCKWFYFEKNCLAETMRMFVRVHEFKTRAAAVCFMFSGLRAYSVVCWTAVTKSVLSVMPIRYMRMVWLAVCWR
jgi:hypothetical protein